MKVLLTGASGFAGAHMLNYLLTQTECEIVCPVTYEHGGHRDRIPALVQPNLMKRVSIIELDLAKNRIPINAVTSDVQLIINFASESHVDRSILNPIDFSLNNTNLMINLLEYARQLPQIKFVHISTDEVYGAIPVGELNREWERPHLPSNPYSASKSAQEALAIAYYKTYKIPIAIVNSTNMIGETQNQEKFLPKVINRIQNDIPINIDTDTFGNIGTRKYVHVWDVAHAVWLSTAELMHEKNYLGIPLKFHISGAKEVTNLELVEIVGRKLGKQPIITISPSPRPGYDLRYELTTEKLSSLGWRESASIEDRVFEIVDWTLKNPDWLFNDY